MKRVIKLRDSQEMMDLGGIDNAMSTVMGFLEDKAKMPASLRPAPPYEAYIDQAADICQMVAAAVSELNGVTLGSLTERDADQRTAEAEEVLSTIARSLRKASDKRDDDTL